MIALASWLRVNLAYSTTDMHKGMTGLAMLVQQTLPEDPFGGAVFAFRRVPASPNSLDEYMVSRRH